jgi:hypothetical protein
MTTEVVNVGGDVGGISTEEQVQLGKEIAELSVELDKKSPPEVKEPVEEKTPESVEQSSDADDQLGPEHDDKTDEEREAIRARRRKERADKKKFRSEKEDSYKREIDGLRRQVAEMNEWKNTVEQRRVHSGVAQLDKALKDSLDAIEVAKNAIREATDTQNGAALVDAQELYYAARKRAEDLGRVKQQIQKQSQQPPRQNVDQAIITHAQGWMQNKSWYDPTGKDPDSRITLTVDNGLAEEGWDPRTPEYWEELDTRLKKYLPHRYNSGYTAPQGDEKRSTPPTGGSSQTRSGSSNSNYTLSPERVRAMKEAGMWDDPDKRKSMIRRYMEQDRKTQSN